MVFSCDGNRGEGFDDRGVRGVELFDCEESFSAVVEDSERSSESDASEPTQLVSNQLRKVGLGSVPHLQPRLRSVVVSSFLGLAHMQPFS